MKYIFPFLLAALLFSDISAQNIDQSNFGKKGAASIRLIDTELVVSKDKSNSILKFEITNNNKYPIYIPQPELTGGSVPQYFDLRNIAIECEFEFMDMITRDATDFIFIPANSSKEFELHSEFFKNSCLQYDNPTSAILVYKALNDLEENSIVADDLMKKDRASRDIIEYLLTTKLESRPIKIIYE